MSDQSASPLKDYSTLQEAVIWLSAQLNKALSEAYLWNLGASGELRFSVGIPNWQAPGDGELEWCDPDTGGKIEYLPSDGFVFLSSLGVKRLQSGSTASIQLANLQLTDAKQLFAGKNNQQQVGVEHIRLYRGELVSFVEREKAAQILAKNPSATEKAQHSTQNKNKTGELGAHEKKHDIKKERGCRRLILESWDSIKNHLVMTQMDTKFCAY